jgi:hypothetical protein
MCDCNKSNTAAAIAFLQEKHGEKFQVSELGAGLVNRGGRLVENRLVSVGYDEYSVLVQPIKKDGSRGTSQKRMVPVVHSYCPHCGEKYPN